MNCSFSSSTSDPFYFVHKFPLVINTYCCCPPSSPPHFYFPPQAPPSSSIEKHQSFFRSCLNMNCAGAFAVSLPHFSRVKMLVSRACNRGKRQRIPLWEHMKMAFYTYLIVSVFLESRKIRKTFDVSRVLVVIQCLLVTRTGNPSTSHAEAGRQGGREAGRQGGREAESLLTVSGSKSW